MPLNPKMKAIIEADQTMTPEYKAKLMATFEDAPADFQNGWMAQSDYTRQVNEFKTHQTEWKTKADEFYTKSNAAVESYKSDAQKAQEAADAAKARIAELEAAGAGSGSGVPKVPDDAVVKELSGLKTLLTNLEGKIGTAVTKEDLNGAYTSAVSFIGEQMFALDEISARHQEMFGVRFDKDKRAALVDFANKRSTELGHRVSLEDAYNQQMSADIEKKKVEKLTAEITEKLKTNSSVPGGGEGPMGGAPIERGPAQIRLEQESNRRAGKTAVGEVGYASWQEAAAAAGQELVTEGKH